MTVRKDATNDAGICVARRATTSLMVKPAGTSSALVFEGASRIDRIAPTVEP